MLASPSANQQARPGTGSASRRTVTTPQLLTPATDRDTSLEAATSGQARVRFRRPASRVGSVDAAWWPYSLDLAAELPPLLDELWTTGHEITRVTYHLGSWDAAPRRVAIGGRVVRLGGFATGDPHTIKLSDAWRRESIDILVIAPTTDAALAERILTLASTEDNRYSAAEILVRTASEGAA